jgi:hypothetical protein
MNLEQEFCIKAIAAGLAFLLYPERSEGALHSA